MFAYTSLVLILYFSFFYYFFSSYNNYKFFSVATISDLNLSRAFYLLKDSYIHFGFWQVYPPNETLFPIDVYILSYLLKICKSLQDDID